jgi:hypothetical protein
MTTSPIRFALTEAVVAEIMDAITARSASRIAGEPDAPHTAIKRRWREIGACSSSPAGSNTGRLVRALEAHKDALRRQMDAF